MGNDEATELNENLNQTITEEEIQKCIKELRNGKASGDGEIDKKYIKNSCNIVMPIYIKLFSLIFNAGKVLNVNRKYNSFFTKL